VFPLSLSCFFSPTLKRTNVHMLTFSSNILMFFWLQ
jgi:hypothetical protein